MKMKNLTVELTPEERDILHSALLNHRLFIERQMDEEKNALQLHRVLLCPATSQRDKGSN